jgi:hypothetical protein
MVAGVHQPASIVTRTPVINNSYRMLFTRSKSLAKPSTSESFLSGTSSVYAEQMYE